MHKLFLILPVLLLAACVEREAPTPQPTATGTGSAPVDECPRADGQPCR